MKRDYSTDIIELEQSVNSLKRDMRFALKYLDMEQPKLQKNHKELRKEINNTLEEAYNVIAKLRIYAVSIDTALSIAEFRKEKEVKE